MNTLLTRLVFAISAGVIWGASAHAADAPVSVNFENFARVETDMQIDRMLKASKGLNTFTHYRLPTPLDGQTVIRMNRDTLYSFALVDISKGATITIPDAGKRYLSTMIINNDGYINDVFYGGGTFKLNMDKFDTKYVVVAVRTLANASDEADIKAANVLQDKMKIEAASAEPFVMPDYDMDGYNATYKPLLELAKGLPSTQKTFGSREIVDPVRFLLGTAFGWGGLPIEDAYYLNVDPKLPIGEYQINVNDVPVDAFWSVSVYNKDGYFQENDFNSYSINNISGKQNEDGSFTVNMGGCEDKRVNCVPLTEGWNYTVRLYKPGKELLDGSWMFPAAEAVKK
ncbi:MAG: DUF1214 domain-containing protein [Rhizobiaceae bacterium]|nr:DUF1214 domain-containing protein [Rhizobiaceae bacterium]